MKYLYVSLRNTFLFFFILRLFAGILVVDRSNELLYQFLIAFTFGALTSFVPNILSFFKIKQSTVTSLFLGVIVTFAYFFVGEFALGIFEIANGSINLTTSNSILTITDQTFGLIVVSVVSSTAVVILDLLDNQ